MWKKKEINWVLHESILNNYICKVFLNNEWIIYGLWHVYELFLFTRFPFRLDHLYLISKTEVPRLSNPSVTGLRLWKGLCECHVILSVMSSPESLCFPGFQGVCLSLGWNSLFFPRGVGVTCKLYRTVLYTHTIPSPLRTTTHTPRLLKVCLLVISSLVPYESLDFVTSVTVFNSFSVSVSPVSSGLMCPSMPHVHSGVLNCP